MKCLLFVLFLSFNSYADVWVVPRSQRVEFSKAKEIPKTKTDKVTTKQSASKSVEDADIEDFLKRNSELPAVWDYTVQFDFKTGSVLRGILINSILSTNIASPVLVEIKPGQGFPDKSKFICKGSTKHQRIFVHCPTVVTEVDEYDVDANLLNMDGSIGLKPDVIYEGGEKMATGAVVSGITQGAVSASSIVAGSSLQAGIATGAVSGVNDVFQMSRSEMNTIEPKVAAYSGKDVLVYFNKRFQK